MHTLLVSPRDVTRAFMDGQLIHLENKIKDKLSKTLSNWF